MAKPTRRVGVVLFQLGGPDTPEAIEPFLFNLFCDPDIIDFPFARIGRKPLAKLISTTRAKKVQHHYPGDRRRFADPAFYRAAGARSGDESWQPMALMLCCFVAMRYWHPFTAEAIAQIQAAGLRRNCAASSLSPILKHNHRQQPQRMAATVPR